MESDFTDRDINICGFSGTRFSSVFEIVDNDSKGVRVKTLLDSVKSPNRPKTKYKPDFNE